MVILTIAVKHLLFLSTNLPRKDSFKDLGVVIDEKLIFREHMHDKINKAYAMFGIIKRNLIILPLVALSYYTNVW